MGVGWQWVDFGQGDEGSRAAVTPHIAVAKSFYWGDAGLALTVAMTDLFGLDGNEAFALFQGDVGAQVVSAWNVADFRPVARLSWSLFRTAELQGPDKVDNYAGRGFSAAIGIRGPPVWGTGELSVTLMKGTFHTIDRLTTEVDIDRPYTAARLGLTWFW